jgi:predicted DNA-binding WGR domain protein
MKNFPKKEKKEKKPKKQKRVRSLKCKKCGLVPTNPLERWFIEHKGKCCECSGATIEEMLEAFDETAEKILEKSEFETILEKEAIKDLKHGLVTPGEYVEKVLGKEVKMQEEYGKTYFEYEDEKSHKFWAVHVKEVRGVWYLMRKWGKIDTKGQSMTETYKSEYEARNRKRELIDEKLAKGYVALW